MSRVIYRNTTPEKVVIIKYSFSTVLAPERPALIIYYLFIFNSFELLPLYATSFPRRTEFGYRL